MKRTPDFVAAQGDRAANLPGSHSISTSLNPRQVATLCSEHPRRFTALPGKESET